MTAIFLGGCVPWNVAPEIDLNKNTSSFFVPEKRKPLPVDGTHNQGITLSGVDYYSDDRGYRRFSVGELKHKKTAQNKIQEDVCTCVKKSVTRVVIDDASSIRFTSGHSRIPERATALLRTVTEKLKDNPGLRVQVVGHTDNRRLSAKTAGIYGDNYGLSRARAKSVARFFMGYMGIPSELIEVDGRGSDAPVHSNATLEGRARNRRTEVEFTYDEAVGCKEEVAMEGMPLSPGDRIRLVIPEGEEFSGVYEIDVDGTLNLPHLKTLKVAGLELSAVEEQISRALVSEGLFLAGFVQVSVKSLQWSAVQVSVCGAVFQPGQVLINTRAAEDRAQQLTQTSGDYPPERSLTAALRTAGGVRPDADISRIRVIRGAKWRDVDLRGLFTGAGFDEVPLTAGDRIIVPATDGYQHALVRPSQVTPPGIRVFMSNLTTPADSNSKSAIGKDSTRLPYGTCMLQGLVAANCVGGAQATNASRSAVLISINPVTGASEVIERSIERLVRDSRRDGLNPHLMPGDAIACYDSGVTNVRDIARTIGDVFAPLSLLRALLGG